MTNNWIQKITKSTTKVGPIGLEFAYEGINAVQLQLHSSGKLTIKDSISILYPSDFELSDYSVKAYQKLVKSIFQNSCFSGHLINTAMPTRELRIISVNYKTTKGQSEAAAVASIVAERIEGDIQDHIVDYLPIRNEDKHENAIAIVALAEKVKVINYLECLRKSGLQVDGLEIAPSAIRRLISAIHKPSDSETVLVVNFGVQTSFLSVMSGRRLLFDESIDIGEEVLLTQLQDSLKLNKSLAKSQIEKHGLGKVSLAERAQNNNLDEHISMTMEQILKPYLKKITHSIKRSATYASSITRGQPLKKIYLLGSLARWRGADRVFSKLLEMEVNLIANPLLALTGSANESGQNLEHPVDAIRPKLAVATGLALRGLQEHG